MFDLNTIYLVISTKLMPFNNLRKMQVLLSLLCQKWHLTVMRALPGSALPILATSKSLIQKEDIQPRTITGTICSFEWELDRPGENRFLSVAISTELPNRLSMHFDCY